MGHLEGHPVTCSPQQLRLHPALAELEWIDLISELNEAARLKNQTLPDPILITPNGTMLSGFGHWRMAVLEGRSEVNCIEYPLDEESAIEFMLARHRAPSGWNPFIRIEIALKLEPAFQEKALANMRLGGKYKGVGSFAKGLRD